MRIQKPINLLVLQVSNLLLARGQCGNNLIVNLSAKRPFIHENFTDFDRVFGISDESGTYNDQESYNLDFEQNQKK